MTIARIRRAIEWAAELHGDQRRKGSGVPYLFHLLAVAALVAEHGGTEEEVVAALLHDAIEDAPTGTPSEIGRRFGEGVAAIVVACSDADGEPKPPWRPRKESFVASLGDAPPSVRLVVAADKLHNARCTARDLRVQGDRTWSLFRGGREGTLWYYDAVLNALETNWRHPILGELRRAVADLRHLAGDTS